MSYGLVKQLQMKANPGKPNAREASANSSVDEPSVELDTDTSVTATVGQICQALSVSRSGYYAHQAAYKKRLAEPTLCAQSVHLKAAFAASQKA